MPTYNVQYNILGNVFNWSLDYGGGEGHWSVDLSILFIDLVTQFISNV
jgi:hypothetical protein